MYMMGTSGGLHQWFINFLIKSAEVEDYHILLGLYHKMSNKLKNDINPFLENLKNERYRQHLKMIYGAQILQICN